MTKNVDIIEEAKALFSKRLQEYIERHGHKVKDVFKSLNIGEWCVRRWNNKESLPSKKKFAVLAKHLKLSEQEEQFIGKAIARLGSLKGLRSGATRRGEQTDNATFPSKLKDIEERMKIVEARVLKIEELIGVALKKDIVPRDASNKLMGDSASTQWDVNGMRFILTKDNFKTIDTGPWTDKEIQDTCLLIEELRRRLSLLAQNSSADFKDKSLYGLSKELTELWRSYQIAQSVVPTEAAKLIDIERKNPSLMLVTSTKKKGRTHD